MALLGRDILESVIDELGREVNPPFGSPARPTTDPAFQALVALSLSTPSLLHRCRTQIFFRLSFTSPEEKKTRPTVEQHLTHSLSMLETHPHLIPYIRELNVIGVDRIPPCPQFSGAFQPNREATIVALDKLFPPLLQKLDNVHSFSLSVNWCHLKDGTRAALLEFLTRQDGGLLKKLAFDYIWDLPPVIPRRLAPTVEWLSVSYTAIGEDTIPDECHLKLQLATSKSSLKYFQILNADPDIMPTSSSPHFLNSGLDFTQLEEASLCIQTLEDEKSVHQILSLSRETVSHLRLMYGTLMGSLYVPSPTPPPTLGFPLSNLRELNLDLGWCYTEDDTIRGAFPPTVVADFLHDFICEQPTIETLTIEFTWSWEGRWDDNNNNGGLPRKWLFDQPTRISWERLDALLSDGVRTPHLSSVVVAPRLRYYDPISRRPERLNQGTYAGEVLTELRVLLQGSKARQAREGGHFLLDTGMGHLVT
ncbi:hypothetical protein CC2G_011558 [Coprinopsis cinerea AmutBmut pab1-1]|nr:hypothetical protein CC2G_011558 [Coprinopsis cinerea AmutBmut pab1-1]